MTLVEAVETIRQYCKGRECEGCAFVRVDEDIGWKSCQFGIEPCYWQTPTETNIYEEEGEKE